jgi:uncharacterized protein with PIN domain
LIVIDSSALVAILRGEPEREQSIDAIVDYGNPRISSATYLEVAMVCGGAIRRPRARCFDRRGRH